MMGYFSHVSFATRFRPLGDPLMKTCLYSAPSDSFYHDDVSYRAAQVSAPSEYYAGGPVGDLGIATESRRYPYCR